MLPELAVNFLVLQVSTSLQKSRKRLVIFHLWACRIFISWIDLKIESISKYGKWSCDDSIIKALEAIRGGLLSAEKAGRLTRSFSTNGPNPNRTNPNHPNRCSLGIEHCHSRDRRYHHSNHPSKPENELRVILPDPDTWNVNIQRWSLPFCSCWFVMKLLKLKCFNSKNDFSSGKVLVFIPVLQRSWVSKSLIDRLCILFFNLNRANS